MQPNPICTRLEQKLGPTSSLLSREPYYSFAWPVLIDPNPSILSSHPALQPKREIKASKTTTNSFKKVKNLNKKTQSESPNGNESNKRMRRLAHPYTKVGAIPFPTASTTGVAFRHFSNNLGRTFAAPSSSLALRRSGNYCMAATTTRSAAPFATLLMAHQHRWNTTTAAAPTTSTERKVADKTATAATSSTASTSTEGEQQAKTTTTSGEEKTNDNNNGEKTAEGGEGEASSADAEAEAPKTMFQKLKAMFKGMTLKEIIKQYGIPIALFYWIFNEVLVAFVTYLLHYNYISQNSVVDIIDALGCGAWIDTKILHTHSIQIGSFSISALLLTNFLVASAFLALFVPVKLPFCIWLYPKLRRMFARKKKVAAGVAAASTTTEGVTAATATAAAAVKP